MTDTETKTCAKCRQAKPLSAFARVRADRPWLRSKCRECVNQADPRRNGGHR